MMTRHHEPGPVAEQIATALEETELRGVGQIARIVWRHGEQRARACREAAQQIEAQDGIPRSDGQERRTPTGVFFQEEDALVEGWAAYDPEPEDIVVWAALHDQDAPAPSARRRRGRHSGRFRSHVRGSADTA